MLVKILRNGYKVEYEEVLKEGVIMPYYIPQLTVYNKNGELILSSSRKEKEEFFNYISFLVPKETSEIIQEIYNNRGKTEEEIDLADISDEFL